MHRLTQLEANLTRNHKPKSKSVADSIAYLDFDNTFFTPEINEYRRAIRKDLEENVVPRIPEIIQKEECMDVFKGVLRKYDCLGKYLQKPYGTGLNTRYLVAIILELGRIDASLATFHLVQNVLFANTIGSQVEIIS